jgi:hypothetical protein
MVISSIGSGPDNDLPELRDATRPWPAPSPGPMREKHRPPGSPHGQAATTHGAGSDTVLPLEPATPTGNPRWHSASHRTELASCAAAARSAIDQPI